MLFAYRRHRYTGNTYNVYMKLYVLTNLTLNFRSGGGVVENTLDYQSRDSKIDSPLPSGLSDETLNRGPVSV